ncbi:MAG: bifunctional methylenetetrahydrofolate dehydrogenase/methenyltetrahydrofolate cyclohydrolase, partial [Patescibacteria group bacterium]
LLTQSIVVLGRGDTAGKPIAELLIKVGYRVIIIHSQTPNPDAITKTADIIVSCVGKPNVVRRDTIKKGAFLLSVGITRGDDGKLHGDYEEDQIRDHASLYTPTPGGVGPVNVACLMENLVQAATKVL